MAVETSVSAAGDGEEGKLKEGGKESMENKKIEGKKKDKNRLWGDGNN